MILALLLACAAPPPAAGWLQEAAPPPGAAAQEQKRAFPRLTQTKEQELKKALYELRSATAEETVQQAAATIQGTGAAAVPLALGAFEKAPDERLALLRRIVDEILVEADLDLAWREIGPKSPLAARVYLTRRSSDSRREEAPAWLLEQLQFADPEVSYQAARGLLLRNREEGLATVLQAFEQRWTKDYAQFRADFKGIERGPLSVKLVPLIQRGGTLGARLAAIHLFELAGLADHAKILKPVLSEVDARLQLAAVNACRTVIDGQEPLAEKSSTMQIVEHLESWKKRL